MIVALLIEFCRCKVYFEGKFKLVKLILAYDGGMRSDPPLPALLSQVLVAFIIEFDNEFERQTPHRTTLYGSTPGSVNPPWLVSMEMWSKFLRFIPDTSVSVAELHRLTGMDRKSVDVWLLRLWKWWGYIAVESPVSAGKSKRISPEAMVRMTTGGRKAVAVWRPLTDAIEERWLQRFGQKEIENLKNALSEVHIQLDSDLPDHLPILGYGLVTDHKKWTGEAQLSFKTLPALLSKVLLAFAIEFESKSEISLAIYANVLRLLGDRGMNLRDLPRQAGVSKEAIAVALSFLKKKACIVNLTDPNGSRAKQIALSEKGLPMQHTSQQLLREIEAGWQTRFGAGAIGNLRKALELLIGDGTPEGSPLFRGLKPYDDGWRASVPKPEALPHYPMILHRGGFPDGA